MICVLCGKKTSVFSHRLADGHICKKCYSVLPTGFPLRTTDSYEIRELYEENLEKANRFDATSNLGSLYLDSVHNLFCISDGQKNGQPTRFGHIFHIMDLTGIGLVCTNVRNTAARGYDCRDNVICDIKFIVKTKKISADYIIKSNIRCSFKYNGNKIEWDEPGELMVYRKMFEQMLDNVCGELTRKLKDMQALIDKMPTDEKWARGILYLPSREELSAEEIKSARNRLIKIFHPDTGISDATYSEKINQAYRILNKTN